MERQYLIIKKNQCRGNLEQVNHIVEFYKTVAVAYGFVNSDGQVCLSSLHEELLKRLAKEHLPDGLKPSLKQIKYLLSNETKKIPVVSFVACRILVEMACEIKGFKFEPTSDGDLSVSSYLLGRTKFVVESINNIIVYRRNHNEDLSNYSVEECEYLVETLNQLDNQYNKPIKDMFKS